VAFVQDDVAEAVEAAAVERVPENLGRHDEDRRAGVHLDVAGENSDRVGAEGAGKIGELLVGERLERSRVRYAALGGEGSVDRELGDERLAGSGRRRDDD